MDSIPQQLLLQAILILINAFFAMTEIAVISLNPGKLRMLAEEGDKTAPRLLKLVEEPSGFLSTIQIAITLSGFLGAAFAGDAFAESLTAWLLGLGVGLPASVLNTVSLVAVTVVLSYFTLVFGELVPKRIAMQKPLQAARLTCGVVIAIAAVLRPVVWLLSVSTNGLLRLLRLPTQPEEESVTEEEIRMMVDLGQAKGTIQREEGEWIDNVFDFGESMARDLMTHAGDVTAFPVTAEDGEILQAIRRTGLSRYPVYDGDLNHVLGILNARVFLLDRAGAHPRPLRELLQSACFVPDTLNAAALLRDMQSRKVHIAVVIDEYGDTAGIITMEDLLEEIVGSIYDEFDPAEPAEIEAVGPGVWKVSGGADIEEVAETLGVDLPEDREFDTLGGLVFSQLHTIPRNGPVPDVEAWGLHVHVDQVDGFRIVSATVRKCGSPPENAAPAS
ncbi:hemolysin family protein [Oscillibacter sp.]|uniref:hemolysin family protein n=1 Tax=Oscillospiraceae TaxID=216572 RepID=UPI0026175F45|nr:hemolysin family protein [Oscillibacter sp.]MBS6355489.1 HlyC/CorC family transporter [Oscillibacter sp.]